MVLVNYPILDMANSPFFLAQNHFTGGSAAPDCSPEVGGVGWRASSCIVNLKMLIIKGKKKEMCNLTNSQAYPVKIKMHREFRKRTFDGQTGRLLLFL